MVGSGLRPKEQIIIVMGGGIRPDLASGRAEALVALVMSEKGILYQSPGFDLKSTSPYDRSLMTWI